MTAAEATQIAGKVVREYRNHDNEAKRVKEIAKIIRDMANGFSDAPTDEKAEIARLQAEVEYLNSELIKYDRGTTKRILRNIELVKENHKLREDHVCGCVQEDA